MSHDSELLRDFAAKYIWWKSPEEALRQPDRIIAQVMSLGEFRDVGRLNESFTDEKLREVLTHADPGSFDERSWNYWHYRLGLASTGDVPAMPRRTFA